MCDSRNLLRVISSSLLHYLLRSEEQSNFLYMLSSTESSVVQTLAGEYIQTSHWYQARTQCSSVDPGSQLWPLLLGMLHNYIKFSGKRFSNMTNYCRYYSSDLLERTLIKYDDEELRLGWFEGRFTSAIQV